MPRVPKFPPYPRRPHSSGQARIKLAGKPVYLGPFGSPESWAAYQQHLARWRTGQNDAAPPPPGPPRTVGELAAHFWTHAENHYRKPDGSPKEELASFRHSLAPLLALHRDTPVADFGPRALKGVLRAMATGSWRDTGGGWCRAVCNRSLVRVKTMIRWCESEELVPAATLHALSTVRGLAAGQYGARERPEVPPAPEADLARTIPELGPVVRELVELLLLTGARPGELCALTPAQVNRSGTVQLGPACPVLLGAGIWAYQPAAHKLAHKGLKRVILFGPRAQAILAPLLEGREPDRPVFSPVDAVARRKALLRAARKTRVQPSQVDRRKADPEIRPGDRYDRVSLGQAIRRACRRAGVPVWTSYQCRHNAATRIVQEFGPELGLEIARVVLGHQKVDTTQIYALADLKAAARAMGQVG